LHFFKKEIELLPAKASSPASPVQPLEKQPVEVFCIVFAGWAAAGYLKIAHLTWIIVLGLLGGSGYLLYRYLIPNEKLTGEIQGWNGSTENGCSSGVTEKTTVLTAWSPR